MTSTLQHDALGEVDRIAGGSKLRRPKACRGRDGRMQRDPGGEWDWFYELDKAERDYISRHHMVDGTTRHRAGIGPDDLGDNLDAWLSAVRDSRYRPADPFEDDYEAAESLFTSSERELVLGLAEIAEELGAKLQTVYKWSARGILPAPDMTVSKAPAWYASTIVDWARDTGRMI